MAQKLQTLPVSADQSRVLTEVYSSVLHVTALHSDRYICNENAFEFCNVAR